MPLAGSFAYIEMVERDQTHPGFETFGVHMMLDGYDADPVRLADKALIAQLLHRIPAELGMHTIAPAQVVEVGPKNRKDPGGLSGVVMIAESHLSFHTFPARRFLTADLYTCQNDLETGRITLMLQEAFAIREVDVHVQRRGLRFPRANL